jgi:diguanylate cyclase (GGDEF)-like protein
LARLHRNVVEAEGLLDISQSARLLEANEQLVLAVLRAQSDAEAASRALEELLRSAGLDALTALPNRVRLLDRFAGAIAHAKRHGRRMALLFLDLNNFKQINDTLGHAVGDEVLKLAAQRLASLVREEDTVSRYGGDEFLILLTEISQASDASLVADKVIAALGVPAVWAITCFASLRASASASTPMMAKMPRRSSTGRTPPCTAPSGRGSAVSSSMATSWRASRRPRSHR